jgi:hypothetical protein
MPDTRKAFGWDADPVPFVAFMERRKRITALIEWKSALIRLREPLNSVGWREPHAPELEAGKTADQRKSTG